MEFFSLKTIFWCASAGVAYTYVVYPCAIAVMARFFHPGAGVKEDCRASISIIVAARNEAAVIGGRVSELRSLLDHFGCPGEIIVVSDGSTDETAVRAETGAGGDSRVRIVALERHSGKAAALSRGCEVARGEILVFADARQRWDKDALRHLVRCFSDPGVGAASGELTITDAAGVTSGVGLYWRYEKWLRHNEGRIHSTAGATGAISAVRRHLFKPIPPGILLDDVYWPMQVVMQGFRVVHTQDARAFDQLPSKPAAEFRRKVRTLSGNYQLLSRLPSLLLPWRNPIWIQFLSHKLFRLAVPWALLLIFFCSLAINDGIYKVALYAQLAFYALALAGLLGGARLESRLTSAAASFLLLNAAAWLGFWVWLLGRSEGSWSTTQYSKK